MRGTIFTTGASCQVKAEYRRPMILELLSTLCQWQLYAFLIDVMQQLVAGFTMCTETGYLTPLAQRDVPEIVLPFRWWDSGQNVCNVSMKHSDSNQTLSVPYSAV